MRLEQGRGEERGGGDLCPPSPLDGGKGSPHFPLARGRAMPQWRGFPGGGGGGSQHPLADCSAVPQCCGTMVALSPPPPTRQGEVMAGEELGEGNHTHPIPASEGVRDHSPPLGGDHNFPLLEMRDPHGGRFQPKVGYGGFFKPRGGGLALPVFAVLDGTSEEFFRWEEGDRSRPPTTQAGSEGAAQGLGLRPAWGGQERAPHAGMTGKQREDGVMGGHGVTDSPQAGYRGALQGLGLWPAQGGGAKRRVAASSSPTLTGASSGTPGNPARRARAPQRRLHGRASSEVT